MTISLPRFVETAINKLNTAGYEAYIVGGCVRDTLLGRMPTDWDITTSALPEEIMQVFAEYRTIPTGLQHGTVTVLIDGTPLEITAYRIDGAYTDNRHPDSVQFTRNLRDDLARRDFTINAIAYHPTNGIVDHFSGLADLSNRRIVCVGDPEKRFTEDALRILRALRFSAQLGFPIEKMTAKAIHRLAPLLRNIAAERVQTEIVKLLCGEYARDTLLAFSDVICVVLPEIAPMLGLEQVNPYHYLNVYEHTVETIAAIAPKPHLRLTMLLHDAGKPSCYTKDENGIDHFRGHPPISAAIAEQTLSRLRFDRQTIDTVKTLVMHHDDTITENDRTIKRLLNLLGVDLAHDLIAVQKADVIGQNPEKRDRLDQLNAIDARIDALVQSNACFSLSDLAIKGDDLLQLGYHAGRPLGDTLHTLLEMVMDDELPNERAALLDKAKVLLNK